MSLLTKGHYSAIDLHCINLSKIYREHMQDFAVRLSRGKIYRCSMTIRDFDTRGGYLIGLYIVVSYGPCTVVYDWTYME